MARALFVLLIFAVGACSQRAPVPPSDSAASSGPSAAKAASAVHPDQWPKGRTPLVANPAREQRIDELLSKLTIEQKVGQLVQGDVAAITPDELKEYPLGSVLNGGNSGPGGNDLAPAKDWLAAADAYYDASMERPNPIPVIWGTDAMHGHSNIIGATIFPHNIGLGATRNSDLIRRIGEITAKEILVTGQDWTFAPTVAVVRDDRWGRTYESYSEDPEIVREYAAAMVTGLQGAAGSTEFLDASHVIATAKHYVGDGGTGGVDQGDNRATEAELRDIHAAGYPPAIAAGVQTVMGSYSSWQGVKMHGHKGLITDVLKDRMGFDGFFVGDWNGHGQVPGCTNESCAAAINAGMDMLMAPNSWKGAYINTLAQAKSGEIPAARLDDAVRRILRVKLRAGVFDKGRPSSRPFAGKFELLGAAEHRAVARQAVRESLVLLKNQNKLLPLSPRQHVLVAGDGAEDISKQCGGWTISWQGTGIPNKLFPNADTIYSGIRSAVRAGGGSVEINVDGKFKRKPSVAIVVFGENPYAEFRGDIANVAFSPADEKNLTLLRELQEKGIPTVSVFISGRPLWVNREINASDAFVAAWLPGTEGGGIADVLFRKPDGSVNYDFHGRLSFSWPATPHQAAVNRDQPGEPPLFPYGYGKRYIDKADVAPLSEDKGPTELAGAETQVFFVKGNLGRGWRFDENKGVNVASTDFRTQEDARTLQWPKGVDAHFSITGDGAIDLHRDANGQVSIGFDYRVEEKPAGDVLLGMSCKPTSACKGSVPITETLKSAPAGAIQHFKMLLTCFEKAGADMNGIVSPFILQTTGPATLSISNIRLESGVEGLTDCPDKTG